ncbi:MAG TPA: DUF5060 domain-containing protein [Candidatus Polarisedimenticolaceae bacterium]|nr:DUF5060 domain-containing protein [Candidatus Polarisedimenticolaceae bacterium]
MTYPSTTARVLRVLLLAASLPLPPVLAAPEFVLPRHDTAEVVLLASRSYDGAQGTPNPFTEVTFALRVTSPTGRVIDVPGFFDGDGLGGRAGMVFKARIYADEPGTWTWTSTSSDPGLLARTGSFEVAGTLPGRWGRGALVVRPSVRRHFTHQDGMPLFLAGKFLDDAAQGRSQRSHPMFSETWTDSDRQALLTRAASLSLNKIAVYLANVGDYDEQPTTPWLGTAGSSDKTRFDLSRWKMYDHWTRVMRDQGEAVQFWLFADDSGFGALPEADRERLIAYAMARLSAYANTFFVLALEWDEAWSEDEVAAHGNFLQSRNPWRRLVSVHGTEGVFEFPQHSWATFMAIQSGLYRSHDDTHAINLENWALARKPSVDEELTFGVETLENRQKTWGALTGGAATLGTGAGLRPLVTLVEQLDLPRLKPDDSLALSGNATILAERGRAYVVYLPEGGTLTLDLTHTSDTFQARWLDPRTGTFQGQMSVPGGAPLSLTAPSSGEDWALALQRGCAGPGLAGAVMGLRLNTGGRLNWISTPTADGYDVVYGDLGALREGLQASLRGCVERNGGDLGAIDPDPPSPGEGRYYLVRARHCSGSVGSFDSLIPAGQEGPRDGPILASLNDCP